MAEPREERPTRKTQFNTRLSEDEVRAEKAVERRNVRSGLLGDLRKRASQLRESLENPEVCFTDIGAEVCQYNRAFRKFVDAHEACMQLESDEEKKLFMSDCYENQRDLKLQLDILFKRRENEYKRELAPSVSNFSKSSKRSLRNSLSSRSSVKERKRLEEAKLNIESLKKRQEIDREIEQMEKGKAELRRKIELLEAETRVKQAVIDLTLEQTDDEVEPIVVDDLELDNDPQGYSPNQHDNQLMAQLKPELSQIPCNKENIDTFRND